MKGSFVFSLENTMTIADLDSCGQGRRGNAGVGSCSRKDSGREVAILLPPQWQPSLCPRGWAGQGCQGVMSDPLGSRRHVARNRGGARRGRCQGWLRRPLLGWWVVGGESLGNTHRLWLEKLVPSALPAHFPLHYLRRHWHLYWGPVSCQKLTYRLGARQ